MEADVRVIPLLEGGHETRNAGSLEKLAKVRNSFSPRVSRGTQSC